MKFNKKGFAVTSIIYSMLVLFLGLTLLISSNMATRKTAFDKAKNDILSSIEKEVMPEEAFVSSDVEISLYTENSIYLKEGSTATYSITINNYDSNSTYEIHEDKIKLESDTDTGSTLSISQSGNIYTVSVTAGSGTDIVRLNLEDGAILQNGASIIPATGLSSIDYLYIDNEPPSTPYVVYDSYGKTSSAFVSELKTKGKVCYPGNFSTFSTVTWGCLCSEDNCRGQNYCAILETQLCDGISESQYYSIDNAAGELTILYETDNPYKDLNTYSSGCVNDGTGYQLNGTGYELYEYDVMAIDAAGNESGKLLVSILKMPKWYEYYDLKVPTLSRNGSTNRQWIYTYKEETGTSNWYSISQRYEMVNGRWKYKDAMHDTFDIDHLHTNGIDRCLDNEKN